MNVAEQQQWPERRAPGCPLCRALPVRFAEAYAEGIPHAPQKGVCIEYFRQFDTVVKGGLAPSFFGKAETYKTYCAAVIARWVSEYARMEVGWCDAAEFTTLETCRFSTDTANRVEDLESVAFLVLDDLTNVAPSTVAETIMTNVVCTRFANNRPTVFTGNFPLDNDHAAEFATRYSPQLARRILRGSTGFRCVTL